MDSIFEVKHYRWGGVLAWCLNSSNRGVVVKAVLRYFRVRAGRIAGFHSEGRNYEDCDKVDLVIPKGRGSMTIVATEVASLAALDQSKVLVRT